MLAVPPALAEHRCRIPGHAWDGMCGSLTGTHTRSECRAAAPAAGTPRCSTQPCRTLDRVLLALSFRLHLHVHGEQTPLLDINFKPDPHALAAICVSAGGSNISIRRKRIMGTSLRRTCQAAQAGCTARLRARPAGPQQTRAVLQDHISRCNGHGRSQATASPLEIPYRNHVVGKSGDQAVRSRHQQCIVKCTQDAGGFTWDRSLPSLILVHDWSFTAVYSLLLDARKEAGETPRAYAGNQMRRTKHQGADSFTLG